MLIQQFQNFYDQICETSQVSEDIREKIVSYFLKILYLHKNAASIYEQKGKVDTRYLKRIDKMISDLEKEKESLLKLFDFRNKGELDSAIEEKIDMIKQVYSDGLKKKEEEEARERLKAQEEEELLRKNMASTAEAPKSSVLRRDSSQPASPVKRPAQTKESPKKKSSIGFVDPREAKKMEMAERQNYEEQMLNLTQQMKAVAVSYSNQIKEDDKLLDKIDDKLQKNQNKLEKSHKKLDDIVQREKKIGFWRLLTMAIAALVLFIVTMVVIFFDRTLFGASK